MISDFWPVLIGVYVGVSLVSHILQFVLWQRMGQRMMALEAQMDAGLSYANQHTNRSIAALNGRVHEN